MTRAAMPLFLALFAVSLTGCFEDAVVDERYGNLLNPADVEDCPANCVPYVTVEGDSLADLARRIYGKTYKLYLIAILPENKDTLEEATKEDGRLQKGKILFMPPDTNGRMIDRHTLRRTEYFGGTS